MLRLPRYFALLLAMAAVAPLAAQDNPPATGDTITFHLDLHPGTNLVALPLLPDSADVRSVVAGLLPHLTLVQDDEGRYYVPEPSVQGLGAWKWYEAYRLVLTAPATLSVSGPEIQPELSPLLVEAEMGNWVPYLRSVPLAAEDAFASVAPSLNRVEDAEGRFYVPGDPASTLDSLRTGQGYKVWVSEPVTLTYPANPGPPSDTTPPAAPTGLVATAGEDSVALDWNDNAEGDLSPVPYTVLRSTSAGGPHAPLASTSVSGYTDAAVTDGTTYYYVVTATDAAGNASPFSAEVSATSQAGESDPPTGGPPTFVIHGFNQRLYESNAAQGKVLNSLGVSGRRLVIGTGTSNNPNFPSRWLMAAPTGVGGPSDSLAFTYTRADGTQAPLPWWGDAVVDPYEQGSEHNAVSACGDFVSQVNDDNEIGGPVGHHWQNLATGTLGRSTLNGVLLSSGAKSSAGAWSENCAMLSIYEHGSSWPREAVSFDGGRTFHTPSVSGPGSASVDNFVPAQKAWVDDTLWIWNQRIPGSNNGAVLGKGYRLEEAGSPIDSFHVEAVCNLYECLFEAADLDNPVNGSVYGPNPNAGLFSARAYGSDLFMAITGKHLFVWKEGATARRVEAKAGGAGPQTHYFPYRDRLYKLEPDGDIHRLASIAPPPGDATPTWEYVSTIVAPPEWNTAVGFPKKIVATEVGDLYIGANVVMLLPYYGTEQNAGSLAWYAPGVALPAP